MLMTWSALSGCAAAPAAAPMMDASPAAATAALSGDPARMAPAVPPTAAPPAREASTATAAPAGPTSAGAATGIVVDRDSVALFDQIPEEFLQAAAGLRMFFMDRSVGFNIDNALDCLAFESDEAAPNRCSRWSHVAAEFSADPAEVDWSRAGGYDRAAWVFQTWPDTNCSAWYEELGCFLTVMEGAIDSYDVVSFQFSYLEVAPGSDIADQPGGFFSDNADRLDVSDLRAYEAEHPQHVFIYWTTSLARGIGSPESAEFNDQMRRFAAEHAEPLFDVADILSHDPAGRPCYDNRDGVPYANGNQAEDYPDDGQALPAICQDYTTEVDGGHLGSVSTGSIRVAKAMWVLMAQIAGWRP